jgi:hypothetical protein
MTNWKQLQTRLWDSNGNHPNDEQLVLAMQEFRASGSIQGYWFVNVSVPGKGPDNDRYADPWNGNAVRPNWEIGPDSNDIDYTGLD